MDIGKNIKAARMAEGLTRYELSLLVGTRESNLYMWETGRRTPRVYQLKLLADVLGVTLDSLTEEFRCQGGC